MAEMAVIDVDGREGAGKEKKQSAKRQRVKMSSDVLVFTPEEREEKIRALNEELQSLFKFFKETVSENCVVLESQYANCSSGNVNAMIAVLLEGNSASYSKLAGEIYEKLKERENTVTIASVKSSVLFAGQRSSYGVGSHNADVLEDETESCLWCWETRDIKLFPSSLRGALKANRTCRRKISERVSAVSAMLPLLQNPSDSQNYKNDLRKASEKLGKILKEVDIRVLAKSLTERNESSAEKDTKKEEKLIVKQLEKNRREEEKEKKRIDRELQKEKMQSEKELKRLQEEAEKEEKRREREEAEMRKQLKRKQEEMERDQRRREKDEAEQKKKRSMQKQASIMERFVQRKKSDLVSQNAQAPCGDVPSDILTRNAKAHEAVTLSIDSALFQKEQLDMEELRKSHLNSWRSLGHSVKSRSGQHWGIRHKPKVSLVKELRISNSKETRQDEELGTESLAGGWGETTLDDKACNANHNVSIHNCGRSRQLLQFDKSYRPAFYGLWPKRSHIVGPRQPFKKDPELDYDIDSDEEWEEEEPGESLSDCDKDDDEIMEEGSLKADDEDESDDGFFVPDGYLSENEGVQGDQSRRNIEEEAVGTAPSSVPEAESEELTSWFRQLKHLRNLTEHALRKNQPLIITNLMHEKAHLLSSDDLTGASKVEQMFLQALEIRSFPGGLVVEVQSDENLEKEDEEACLSNNKNNLVAAGSAAQISDSELSKIVSVIQSCPYGMSRVVESLLLKFPNYSKSQLRSKVREVSDFVDNKWQVKKEILDKLGLSSSPERTVARTKPIAAFFSKRCLPPSKRCVDPTNVSPVSSHKTTGSQEPQSAKLHTHQVPL